MNTELSGVCFGGKERERERDTERVAGHLVEVDIRIDILLSVSDSLPISVTHAEGIALCRCIESRRGFLLGKMGLCVDRNLQRWVKPVLLRHHHCSFGKVVGKAAEGQKGIRSAFMLGVPSRGKP